MAPEIILRQPYGVKVDVWAIGMFVIELGHRSTPFHVRRRSLHFIHHTSHISFTQGMPPKAVLDRLQAFGPPELPRTGKGKKWSNDMRQFVKDCLVRFSASKNEWSHRHCHFAGDEAGRSTERFAA